MRNIGILLIGILLTACLDEEIFEAEGVADTQLNPSYSLPIGHFEYNLNNYLDTLPQFADVESFQDTIIYLEDTLPVIEPEYQFTDSVALRLAPMNTDNRYIRSVTFLIGLENYYPTQIKYQVYFTYQNRIIIDSLFREGPYELGAADISSATIAPSTHFTTIDVDENVIDNILNITDLLIKGSIRLQTGNTTKLRISPEYRIETDLSMRVGLTYNTEDINP